MGGIYSNVKIPSNRMVELSRLAGHLLNRLFFLGGLRYNSYEVFVVYFLVFFSHNLSLFFITI